MFRTVLLTTLGVIALAAPAMAGMPVNTIVVTTTADGLNAADGACSLREALRNANSGSAFSLLVGECPAGSNVLTDEIVLSNGQTYMLTVPGPADDQGDLDVYAADVELDLRIVGVGGGPRAVIQQTIPGERIMEIHGAKVELEQVFLRGGNVDGAGGAIRNAFGRLRIRSSNLAFNRANTGGAIYSSGFLRLEFVTMVQNEATLIGGGAITISSDGADPAELEVFAGVFQSNTAPNGGAIFNSGGALDIRQDAAFSLNAATAPFADGGQGGGVIFSDDHVAISIVGSSFVANESASFGGAIRATGGPDLLISDSNFIGNSAASPGGAIYLQEAPGRVTIVGGLFENNTSMVSGGAIRAQRVTATDTRFEGNQAMDGAGGAIRAFELVNLVGVALIGNSAAGSGGAVSTNSGIVTSAEVTGNFAQTNGGGVSAVLGMVSADSLFVANTANGDGGGFHVPSGGTNNSTLGRNLFFDNQAGGNGGAIFMGRNMNLANTTLSGNRAGNGGGLYITETGTVTATNITLAFNLIGQDLYKFGDLILKNSILGTPGQTSCTMGLDNPLIQSQGHNISTDSLCFGLTQPGDQVVANAMLDALANYGGSTMTHALLPGSPAINAADVAACTADPVLSVDQRQAQRPFGGGCDVGAHEQGAPLPDELFENGFE